jgi:hypothetical protein
MPIWLRKFYLKKTQEALDEQKKKQEDANSKAPGSPKRVIRK